MTCIIDTNSKRHLSTKLAAGLAISALLVLGTSLASASAEDRRDDHRGGDRHGDWHGGGAAGIILRRRWFTEHRITLHRRWFMAPPSAYTCRASASVFNKRLIRGRPPAGMPAAVFVFALVARLSQAGSARATDSDGSSVRFGRSSVRRHRRRHHQRWLRVDAGLARALEACLHGFME